VAVLSQASDDVAADEPGTPGDENLHRARERRSLAVRRQSTVGASNP
jgi:hypothetical protein